MNISFQKAPLKEQEPPPESSRAPGEIPALLRRHRELVSALVFFVVMMTVFTIASPSVWLNSQSYTAVFVSLPIYIILTVSLVFVVVSGEIDLSFPSVVGVSALVFTESYLGGVNPFICLFLAIL